ncbi:MAG: tail fiber domain-containing protein [Bacteroidota bacterium]|nr:tail fiber domain-containing protein [Bacteroidota bacterium]
MKKIYLLITLTVITGIISAQNVGIGASVPKARLHIVGIADSTQLIIDANSTQSNSKPLIRLRNSSGVDLMWIHSDDLTNCFVGLNAGQANSAASGANNNTFIGSSAGLSNTLGSNNTAVGARALIHNTTGFFNTGSGVYALESNTTGNYNTATGMQALVSNYTGSDNTAAGVNALFSNSTAGLNVAIGNYSLASQSYDNGGVSWSSGNTAVGYSALSANDPTTTGNGINNTALGIYALTANTIGFDNTAIGSSALFTNTTGVENTATGRQSLFYNTTGYNNTATGFKALRSNSTGSDNTASGDQALFSNDAGVANTANGAFALYSNSTGSGNTGYGSDALSFNSTGNNNVGIGSSSNVDLLNSSQNTIIGATAHVSGNNDVAIGFNSFTNVNNLALLGSATTTQCGGYANWSNFSDGRFKTNVEENVKGLDFILRLRPVTYHMDVRALYNLWNISPYGKDENKMTAAMKSQTDDAIKNKEAIRMSGFIAQEVEKAAQNAGYDFDGVIKPAHDKDHYRLAYGEFVVPLVKAVQEQQKMIEDMKKEIEELKKLIMASAVAQPMKN